MPSNTQFVSVFQFQNKNVASHRQANSSTTLWLDIKSIVFHKTEVFHLYCDRIPPEGNDSFSYAKEDSIL